MRGWHTEFTTNVHVNGSNLFSGGFVQIGFSAGGASGNSFTGAFDPGAGTSLPIPGPNGGASGFLLGAWPLNIARELRYSADLNEFGFRFGYGKRFQVAAGTTLAPVLFGTYSRLDFSESLSGSIPGFGRDFRYWTDVNVNRFGFGFGVQGETSLGSFAGYSGRRGDFWTASLRYAGEFSGFRVSASGRDSLAFTGFATSAQSLDTSELDWGARLRAGIALTSRQGVAFAVEGGYERRPGYPAIVRNGTDPSELQSRSADVWSARAAVRLTLDAQGRLVATPIDPEDLD